MSGSQNEEAPSASDDDLSNLGRFYKHCWEEAHKAFYEEENAAKCRYLCRELLVDPQLPLLYRVTTNLLFANLQEPEDAVEFIEQALYWLGKIPKLPDLESIAKGALEKVQAILAEEEEETRLRVEDFLKLAGVDELDFSSPDTAAVTTTQSASDSMVAAGKDQPPTGRRSASRVESRPAFTLEPSTAVEKLQSLSLAETDRETFPANAATVERPNDDSHNDSDKSLSMQRKGKVGRYYPPSKTTMTQRA